ncbi:MAG TPA: ATP-dependent zinc metalloprotease FtsH [Verrucomicrobiae bacterium]|nr:ATP-dependent zinc metalloprotease FtsH [Verrucomicrobiae bacterium]
MLPWWCLGAAMTMSNFERPKDPGSGERRKPPRPRWSSPLWYLPLMLLLLWFWQSTVVQLAYKSIPYSEFKQYLRRGEVTECTVKETSIEGTIRPKAAGGTNAAPASVTNEPAPATTNKLAQAGSDNKQFLFRTVRVEDPDLVGELEKSGANFRGERPSFLSQFMVAWILPIGIMVLIWLFISRKMAGAGESILSFGKSRARLVAEKETGVTFQDVAGCEEAKYELQEVVDFLKHPDRYKSMGASIPKGVLLIGPPGTGKTLLAKAVAGEAHVPFFSLSGSDFVEMFVGVGAARVRDSFAQAKTKAPCIIFIDELDAIGRQRGVHVGAVNDEREQTLNQLLVELDGFAANAGVIVLAATNRPDVLDRALLRPGRFDRQVVVDAPDLEGREAILKVHVRGKPLAREVDLRRVAQATPGFSGADLANALNEAALLAARRKATEISQKDLEDAVEKVVAGPERKSRRLKDEEKRRVAYHEVGHALVAAYSKGADPVHKISIIPRGRAALGYTMQLPADDHYLMTRSQLLDRIRGMLGGRAAEEIVLHDITTGAENDLEHATALARQMVCLFGMSDAVGLVRCAQRQNGMFVQGIDGTLQRDCSEQTAEEIDHEVRRILDRSYREAKEILEQHREDMDRVAEELLKVETLDAARFNELIGVSQNGADRPGRPVELAPPA